MQREKARKPASDPLPSFLFLLLRLVVLLQIPVRGVQLLLVQLLLLLQSLKFLQQLFRSLHALLRLSVNARLRLLAGESGPVGFLRLLILILDCCIILDWRRFWGRWLRRTVVFFLGFWWRLPYGHVLCRKGRVRPRSKNQLLDRARLVGDPQNYVVELRSIEQAGENIFRLSGAKLRNHAIVVRAGGYIECPSGLLLHRPKYLGQRCVLGFDGQ